MPIAAFRLNVRARVVSIPVNGQVARIRRAVGVPKSFMKKTFLSGWLVSKVAAVAALALITTMTALAKDAPKLKISDHDVDRTGRGASYAPVIKRVTPSVVTIQSTRTITMRQN